jgi:hypothetical protein
MQEIERQVRREARAMTRREVITKAIAKRLSWVQAAEIIGIKPRQMRRIRWRVEHYGLDAVMDQRGGRPPASGSKPAPSSCSAGSNAMSTQISHCAIFTNRSARNMG